MGVRHHPDQVDGFQPIAIITIDSSKLETAKYKKICDESSMASAVRVAPTPTLANGSGRCNVSGLVLGVLSIPLVCKRVLLPPSKIGSGSVINNRSLGPPQTGEESSVPSYVRQALPGFVQRLDQSVQIKNSRLFV